MRHEKSVRHFKLPEPPVLNMSRLRELTLNPFIGEDYNLDGLSLESLRERERNYVAPEEEEYDRY